MRVAGKALVVRMRRLIGSGGMVNFSDKATEMANTNQFFNFILECFTFLCGMVVVSVMSALGGVVVLRGGGMRSACKASSRRQDLGTFRRVYLVKRGCRGSRGLRSGRGGCGVGLAVEGA